MRDASDRRAKKSTDPELESLGSEGSVSREWAQQEHLHLLVTKWRLQFQSQAYQGEFSDRKVLIIDTHVPKAFEEYSAITIYAYAGEERDPERIRVGVVEDYRDASLGLQILLFAMNTIFDDLVSCLRENIDDTHTFMIHVTTKNSLEEIEELGGDVVEFTFDFDQKEDRPDLTPLT